MGLSSRTIRPGSTNTAAFIFAAMMLTLVSAAGAAPHRLEAKTVH
jgi:hypothetical protein